MKLLCLVLIALSLSPSNTCTPQVSTNSQSNALAKIKLDSRIPPADPSKYKDVGNGDAWQNPSLVVYPDGIEIISKSPLAERKIVPAAQLAKTLVALPLMAWPYGRVIAISETSLRNGFFGSPIFQKDEQLISRNKIEAE